MKKQKEFGNELTKYKNYKELAENNPQLDFCSPINNIDIFINYIKSYTEFDYSIKFCNHKGHQLYQMALSTPEKILVFMYNSGDTENGKFKASLHLINEALPFAKEVFEYDYASDLIYIPHIKSGEYWNHSFESAEFMQFISMQIYELQPNVIKK